MKRTTRRPAALVPILLVLVALLAVLLGPARATPSGSGPSRQPRVVSPAVIEKTRKIGPGLVLKRFIDKKTPRRTFVLVADLTKPLTLDVALADRALPSREKVSTIARHADALAAINGDFTDRHAGHPVHPFVQDGEFLQTVLQRGSVFAVSQDENDVYLSRPDVSVTVTDTTEGQTWSLARWNQGFPVPGEIAGYSPLGGTLDAPPDHACSVRLLPSGPASFSTGAGGGIDRTFTVEFAACQEAPLTRNGGVVLSAPPATDEATQLLALALGTPMQLHWSVGLSGVLDVVGGVPQLVADGEIIVDPTCSAGLCAPNPRTGIGVRADGKILLVVVDGRQKKWSVGPTLFGFARIMRDLGAVQALNLDGGGSTTMVVDGAVVNRPSSGFERAISNAVLVLPGPDPGEG